MYLLICTREKPIEWVSGRGWNEWGWAWGRGIETVTFL